MTTPPLPPRGYPDDEEPRDDRTTRRLTRVYRALFVVFTVVVVAFYATQCAGVLERENRTPTSQAAPVAAWEAPGNALPRPSAGGGMGA